MRKIPVPVMVVVALVAVSILAIVIYKGVTNPGGDSGDVQAITKDIMKNNPKNAPEMPADQQPAATAMMPGKGKKGR